jgi:hypothetical protein
MKSQAKVSVEDLIKILLNCPTGLHIEQMEETLWKLRCSTDPVRKNFRASIYATLSLHTSQSIAFRQKCKTPAQDLFFSPGGKGSGTWAVHRERAEAWLRRRMKTPPGATSEGNIITNGSGDLERDCFR